MKETIIKKGHNNISRVLYFSLGGFCESGWMAGWHCVRRRNARTPDKSRSGIAFDRRYETSPSEYGTIYTNPTTCEDILLVAQKFQTAAVDWCVAGSLN